MALELITRRGCHLCAEAAAALESLGVVFVERDVDADAELLRLYDFRIPVVLRGGEVIAEGRIEAGRLRAALAR